MTDKQVYLPANGIPKETILAEMQAARSHDVQWRDGRSSAWSSGPATR